MHPFYDFNCYNTRGISGGHLVKGGEPTCGVVCGGIEKILRGRAFLPLGEFTKGEGRANPDDDVERVDSVMGCTRHRDGSARND